MTSKTINTMTDQPKRGRGRPRKDAAKMLIVQSDEPAGSETGKAIIEMVAANPKISTMVEKSLAMGKVPIMTLVDSKPYPKDWEKMSKTEKLSWYSQNKK